MGRAPSPTHIRSIFEHLINLINLAGQGNGGQNHRGSAFVQETCTLRRTIYGILPLRICFDLCRGQVWHPLRHLYVSRKISLIHEGTHFNDFYVTDNSAYGADACEQLANNEPLVAADSINYAYFSVNVPDS